MVATTAIANTSDIGKILRTRRACLRPRAAARARLSMRSNGGTGEPSAASAASARSMSPSWRAVLWQDGTAREVRLQSGVIRLAAIARQDRQLDGLALSHGSAPRRRPASSDIPAAAARLTSSARPRAIRASTVALGALIIDAISAAV